MDSTRSTPCPRTEWSAEASQPMRLASSLLGERRHVCAFFNSPEEEYRVTLPCIKEGFQCGEKASRIVSPGRCDDRLQPLTSAGIDIATTQRSGQFELHRRGDTYLRDEYFDLDRQLAPLEEVLASGQQQGLHLSRFLGDMEGALERRVCVDRPVEYESKINYLWPRYKDPTICIFDFTRFGGDVFTDVLRTHPMIVIGGIPHQHPFYVEPDEFLQELRIRGAIPAALLRSAV